MLVQPVISPGSEGLWVGMGWQGLGGSPCPDVVVGKKQMQHLGNQCHSGAVVLQVPAGSCQQIPDTGVLALKL